MDFAPVRSLSMTLAQLGRWLRDPSVPGWRKLVGVAAVAYVVLPADLVPDVVPVLGWLDDAGVVALAMTLLSREVARHSAARAQVVAGESVRRLR